MNEISADDPTTEASSIDEVRAELATARQQALDLQAALDSRVVIEQAKGVLRERFAEAQHVRVAELEAEIRAQQERLAWKQREQAEGRRPPDPRDRQ